MLQHNTLGSSVEDSKEIKIKKLFLYVKVQKEEHAYMVLSFSKQICFINMKLQEIITFNKYFC